MGLPRFTVRKVIHVGFDDLPTMIKSMADEREMMAAYARVRDQIQQMFIDPDLTLTKKINTILAASSVF